MTGWVVAKRIGSSLLAFLDGEFLLRWLPNSGGVVVARAGWLSCLLLLAYIAAIEFLRPGASLDFCGSCFQRQLADNLKLWGAIFAGAYAALYARFSSQWLYLAGLYNQIMATQVALGESASKTATDKLALWKAGFIEDAVAVHLAQKPMYAAVIIGMLSDPQVRDAYIASTVDGALGLGKLEARLKAILKDDTVARLAGTRAPGELAAPSPGMAERAS
jgi:hypothetical protein